MKTNWLLAIALLSCAVGVGCSANGMSGGIAVIVSPSSFNVGISMTKQFTAKVNGATNSAVSWGVSQSGTNCSPTCGTIASDGTYTAPSAVPSSPSVTITATSAENSKAVGTATATVVHLTVNVTPNEAPATNVGAGLQQQFTARVLPDGAPQTVAWAISGCGANDCGNVPDANGVYTAPGAVPSEKSFQIQATSTSDASGSGSATVSVISSRIPAGPYSFSFSGYDGSNVPVSIVGSFVSDGTGGITSGTEDVWVSGSLTPRNITGGTYSFIGGSNDHGSIALNASNFNRTYAMVVGGGGDIQIIENDGGGHGAGVIQAATPSKFKNNASLSASFVFGFTGTDHNGKRVGYAGLLPMDGAGNITDGLLDINASGTPNAYTGVTGTYAMANGAGNMTLSAGGFTYDFDLFGVGGANNATNPLTLYAISTDLITDSPAMAGTVVYQDSSQTYNNALLSDFEVINLTGVNGGANVSLTLASPDKNGHIGGSFDQNNAGTITTTQNFDSCPYNATGSGRYTISLLGNAGCTTSTPFVFYARGANRGFLLDQSSASVMTGTMDLQKASIVVDSDMFGPFVAGTASLGSSGATATLSTLQMTAGNPAVFGGTQYSSQNSVPLAGTYVMQGSGDGKLTLTQPGAASYVMYAIDPAGTKDTSVAHFWIMDVTKDNVNSSIALAQR